MLLKRTSLLITLLLVAVSMSADKIDCGGNESPAECKHNDNGCEKIRSYLQKNHEKINQNMCLIPVFNRFNENSDKIDEMKIKTAFETIEVIAEASQGQYADEFRPRIESAATALKNLAEKSNDGNIEDSMIAFETIQLIAETCLSTEFHYDTTYKAAEALEHLTEEKSKEDELEIAFKTIQFMVKESQNIDSNLQALNKAAMALRNLTEKLTSRGEEHDLMIAFETIKVIAETSQNNDVYQPTIDKASEALIDVISLLYEDDYEFSRLEPAFKTIHSIAKISQNTEANQKSALFGVASSFESLTKYANGSGQSSIEFKQLFNKVIRAYAILLKPVLNQSKGRCLEDRS